MRVPGLDLFDPRASSMEPDYTSSPPGDNGEPDFGFAFNDRNFSDRILRIEVVAGTSEERPESEAWAIPAGWAARRNKRRRGYINKREKALDINKCSEEQILDPIPDPDPDHGLENENHDEDKILMIEDCPSGDETVDSDDSNCSEDGSKVLRVETLHISSLILAAKSPFFYKLFSNGTVESEPRHVSLRINASEEAALMELLNFMYTSILTSNSSPALLAVLMAADKFEVASCMRYCCRLLKDLPMTPESALWYLDLPSKVLMAGAVQHLTDAAKQFLAARYKDISKYPNEVMKLPLAGIEAVLSSSDLQVPSEDAVYDIALKWTRTHYQSQVERRDILSAHLGRHIRFSYLTTRKLRKLLSCPDFDHDFATKAVLDALFLKAEFPHHQRSHHASEANSTDHHYVERAYKYRPIKVVEFELPRQQCVVYLDLKREECATLFPSGRVYSQAFHLGGQGFFLSAHCNMDQQCSSHCFGLFLGMQDKGAVSFGVDYEFSVRTNTSEEFVSKYKGNYTFTGGKAVGYRNLFGIPWSSFMAEDSNYFMYDILHLRAELTVKKEAF